MIDLSKALFESFLEDVVLTHVFSDAERNMGTGPLTEKSGKDIAAGKRIDDRVPYLMTISGKGGHVEGAAFAAREPFRNINLLDHAVSVARGAAVFAEVDLRAAGVGDDLERRLALLIATGFLHDADKMLQMTRFEELTAQHIDDLMSRYGMRDYLKKYDAAITPADMLSMINAVEMTRSDLVRPGMRLLSAQEKADAGYVRLADRLEGHFLDSRKGLNAMIAELQAFGGFRTDALKQSWRRIHMRAPHTPFLLSNFQLGLSASARNATGMPPLLEIHHDGEFMAIIPEKNQMRSSRQLSMTQYVR